MANAVPFVFGKSLGANKGDQRLNMTDPNDQKLKDIVPFEKKGEAFDLPYGRLLKIGELKIGELKMMRWPGKRNPFEGKPKSSEWRRPEWRRRG
jgi:hypothetical protein